MSLIREGEAPAGPALLLRARLGRSLALPAGQVINAVSGIRTRTVLFGRQPLYRLELPPRHETRDQQSSKRRAGIEPAPSALARRRSGPLNYRRIRSLCRLSSRICSLMGQVGIEPTPAVLQTAARPSSCRPGAQPPRTARACRGCARVPRMRARAADARACRGCARAPRMRARAADAPPVGLAPTTSCLTSKRSCCLSYGGVLLRLRLSKSAAPATQRRVEDSNPRGPRRPRALATRCITALPTLQRTCTRRRV